MRVPVVTASQSMSPPPPRTRPGFGLRLWCITASPRWTLLLLTLLALAGTLSLLLPQAESIPLPVQGQWLATLRGRYGRWMGLLNSLGLFDIAHALWLQMLLLLTAFQSLVAAAQGCGQAWNWLRPGAGASPQLPPSQARERGGMSFPSPLAQVVAGVESAFRRLGYRVCVSREEKRALLEAMRHPCLTLGRPLAHGGVVLLCVAGLLSGRLDWQEGPVVLCPGGSYELRHVAGTILRLEKLGLARGSPQLHSWVNLLRGEQVVCPGLLSPARELSCQGVHIQQGEDEPALHIVGHDRAGHPLALQPARKEEAATSGIILPLPAYQPYRSMALPAEGGLILHIEASSDQASPRFRLEGYSVEKSALLLRREITGPTSLDLNDLTLTLSPVRVPSFQIYHHPTQPLRWAGLSLMLAGLLVSLTLLPFHLWAQIEEREGEAYLRLWQGHPLPFRVSTIREIESQMGSSSSPGAVP